MPGIEESSERKRCRSCNNPELLRLGKWWRTIWLSSEFDGELPKEYKFCFGSWRVGISWFHSVIL